MAQMDCDYDDSDLYECFGPDYDYDDDEDLDFAHPGGTSALRAATKSNPRNLPCPNCDRKNVLTPKDVKLGYQCDACADALERGGY